MITPYLLLPFSLCGALISGCATHGVQQARHDFEEAVVLVQNNYVNEVDVTQLVSDAVASMRHFADASRGEAHPQANEQPIADDQADIGLLLVKNGEWIRIAAVTPGSAAEAAGMNRGDAIIAINGQSTAGMSLSWCYQRLSGAEGTVVDMTVNSEEGEVVDYRVVRTKIPLSLIVISPSGQSHLKLARSIPLLEGGGA